MAASIKGFPKDTVWPSAATGEGPYSLPIDPIMPERSLQQDRRSCSSWLLPPEPATGLEAVVQAVSKGAGVALLLAGVLGILWLTVG